MESVTINGKKYVKAKEIARDLGYTADYVGQLCRSGKVDAQLVGRSWYVQEDSIRAHKNGRYRSNKKTVLTNVERQLQTRDLDRSDSYHVAVHSDTSPSNTSVYANHSFYKRLQQTTVPRYEPDVTDLIPVTNNAHKTGKISVQLADAHSVRVRTKTEEYGFDVTPPPELRFQGKVPVRDCEDDKALENQQKQVEASVRQTQRKKKSSSAISAKTRKIKVKQRTSSKKKKKGAILEHNTDGVLAMTRARISDRNPMGGTLKIESSARMLHGTHAPVLLTAVFAAIAVSVALTSMVQVISVSDQNILMQYTFDFNALKAIVYSAFE